MGQSRKFQQDASFPFQKLFFRLQYLEKSIHNSPQIGLRLFHVLALFLFSGKETVVKYYLQIEDVRVVSRAAQQLKA